MIWLAMWHYMKHYAVKFVFLETNLNGLNYGKPFECTVFRKKEYPHKIFNLMII